jgi:hypothetical protein
MKLEVYQIVVPIISIVGTLLTIRQYRHGNNTMFETILWSSLWIFIALVAVFPNKTTLFLSKTIGIKDHINAIIFIGLAISFFLIFRMFNMVKKMNRQITDLVRKLAIENELKVNKKA